jgi:uncharacterized protein
VQRPLLILWLWFALAASLLAETIPPKPANYFNDYAGVVDPAAARSLDAELRQFERDTSNQIVAAIFPKMDSATSIEDYAQRVFDAWKVGQAKPDNGALLLVFIQDRKMRIHTGYGLEGALPDITCRQIIENEIRPPLRAGNYEAGLRAGLTAMMKATRGEYQGTGRVAGDRRRQRVPWPLVIFMAFIALNLYVNYRASRRRGTYYDRRGRHREGGGWIFFPSGGGWGGGGGGGNSGGGDGGGFSGGGGMSGGGGASGDW